jgi:hypothetical protein
MFRSRRVNKPAAIMAVPSVFFLLIAIFGFSAPVQATFTTNTQIANSQGYLQGEFAEVGVRANGAFGSTGVPSGFHQNPASCLGFRVDREMDGWGTTTDDGDYFCPGSPFEGWQVKVGSSLGKNDHGQTGVSGAVSDVQNSGSSQCVSWNSASPYNGVSISQRYCVPTAGQALHTDVTLTNTTGAAISNVFFGRGFDPDNATGSGTMTCAGSTITTGTFYSCNAVTGQGTEAQATARWGNGSFIALQSFDARARVARQIGGFSSPDPADIWNAGNTLDTSGAYLGNVGELGADAGLYVALQIPTLGAGASTSFRISYVLSAEGNNAPVLGAPVVSGIGQTSATVASTVNPKGFSTTATLVYSTDPDFGTSSSVSMGTFTGSDELDIDAEITGLDPSETYYAKIVATNETGETESAVFDFDTLSATAPTISSEAPTVTVDDGPVTLTGTVNPNGFSATAVFQYSTTSDFSGTIVDVPVAGNLTGTSDTSVSTTVSGLTGSTTYYYRLKVTNASGTAYSPTVSFVPNDIPAPTSLVVTSLEDTTANGTLRWAITQANATAGGIYDSITFGIDGTISLASALPQITQNVTITGNGRTQSIIDGNNLHRIFNVPSGRSLAISDMTLKQGQNVYGGLIYNSQGTVVATNIRFTAMTGGSAVWNNAAGSTATYTNCTFDYLSIGIGGDHGSTPQLPAGVTTWADQTDSAFQNKTYVNNCVFSNNGSGINTQRFTKVQNSTFTNNGYAVSIQGLNRGQVLNSTFTNNGIGVYHNGWLPPTFNMGTDNRLISGNTFTTNGIAIYLDDTYNNGQKNQSWSTVTGNSWDASGVWIRHYQWNGTTQVEGTARPYTTGTVFTQSSNTFPDTIGAPRNLTATDTGSGILLDWDAPTSGGYLPERYAISWSGSLGGGGIATGNVGGANALNTSIEIPYSTIYSFGEAGETFPFYIRSDNDTFSKYSANSNTVSIQVGISLSTTTTSSSLLGAPTESTTTTEPEVVVAPVVPEPETTIPEETTPETEETLPEETETEETLPETTDETVPSETETETESGPSEESTPESEEVLAIIDDLPDDATAEEVADAVFEAIDGATAEEIGAVLESVFEEATEEEMVAILATVFEYASAEEVVAILSEAFADGATDEEVAAVTEAILSDGVTVEAVSTLIDVLDSGVIDESQVQAVVDAILVEELNEEVSIELATSAAVIQNITAEQATDIFESVPVGELSAEDGSAIVDAVQDAPVEVKESFEEEINVFAGVFDDYVALGSTIDVGTRRSVIAVNLVTSTVALTAAAGGLPTPSSSTSTPKQDLAARKPEEGEEEEGGAIEGEGPDWIKRISIYKYEDGVRVMDWKNFARKFVYGIMASGFTLAGATVMYFTLSGLTQQIALWGTVLAFTGSMYLHMKEPDGE